MNRFNWQFDGCIYRATVGDVTLVASPDRMKNAKPARGTKWRAQCSLWTETTRTITSYGRDEYINLQCSAKAAMRLAEDIFNSVSRP